MFVLFVQLNCVTKNLLQIKKKKKVLKESAKRNQREGVEFACISINFSALFESFYSLLSYEETQFLLHFRVEYLLMTN